MKKTFSALVVLGFTAALLANADGVQPKTTLFNCFNPAQRTDAPAVSVTRDSDGTQHVEIRGRQGIDSVAIAPSDTTILIDGIQYEGPGVTVREFNDVEDVEAVTTVKIDSLALTYTCTRVISAE